MDRKLKISNFWDVQNCPMVCFGLSIKYAFFISWVIGRSWCEFIKILPYLRSGNVVLICCFSLRTLITFPCLVWCRKSFWTIARSAHRKMIWIIQKQGTQNKYMTWRHIVAWHLHNETTIPNLCTAHQKSRTWSFKPLAGIFSKLLCTTKCCFAV